MSRVLRLPDGGVLLAVLLRETRAALVNRYLQVFSVLALCGGIAAVPMAEVQNAAAFLLLQIAQYFVTLFAVLVGVSSARAESDEWALLFAQPVPRSAYIFGKFITLWAIFGAILTLLFLPAILQADAPAPLLQLFGNTLFLAAIFGSLGLLSGVIGHDRVQALMIGITAWLFLLFGVDLLAFLAAQRFNVVPDVWVAALMANPLDAFRIQALFALGQVPADAADKTRLAAWWLSRASLWFVLLSALWTLALLALASRRFSKVEL
jgi:ABC-type transport system involved in multi-copper enzyme maturation permease subunit